MGEALWSKVNSGVGAALSQDYVATCSSTLENINKKIVCYFPSLIFITKHLAKERQQWLMNFTYSITSSSLSKSSSSSSPSSSSCLGSCWARADLRMMSGQAAMIGEITNTVHRCIRMLYSHFEYFWARTYSGLLRCIQITTAIFGSILVILNLACVKIAIHLQHHVYLPVWPSIRPLSTLPVARLIN